MANSYFEFKQFTIHQDRCAMKVCTDSCIFGAYAAVDGAKRILDIGTGTGLLALMIAQRSPAFIDAVEIDREAYQQAVENVKQSTWAERIAVFNQPIQAFAVRSSQPYDLIISNPPFYTNNLKRPLYSQNVALHSEELGLSELVILVSYLLKKEGRFIVMLPPFESTALEESALQQKLFPSEKLHIYDRVGGKRIRVITTFAFSEQSCQEDKLYIKDERDLYSEAFKNLLKEYYLHL